jgi:hypothetical protein
MKRSIIVTFACMIFSAAVAAQSPVPVYNASDRGTVSGKTYTNRGLGFEITFPDSWLIPGDDLDERLKSEGVDTTLKAPENLDRPSKIQLERALERVEVLLTAYRSVPGTPGNAILRISIEDLRPTPQIKDAVDYFDVMRSQYAVMRLPSDFKYTETNAEKLGSMQFGFLDTSNAVAKKRMYATVRGGFALMFTLSYTKPEDLKALRDILATGNFNLK